MKFLNILRWIFASLFTIVTVLIILAAILAISVTLNITNKQTVKSWLQEGGIYENMVEVAADTVLMGVQETSRVYDAEFLPDGELGDLLSAEEIRQEAGKLFPEDWIKQQTEEIIDSFYAYLNGNVQEFRFAINLSPIQQNGREVLGNLLKQKIAALPECSPETLKDIENFNFVQTACLPAGLSAEQMNSMLDVELAKLEIFDKPLLSSDELKDFYPAEFQNYGPSFRIAKYSWVGFLILILIFSLILWMLVPGRQKKFNVQIYIWFEAGVLAVLVALALRFGFSDGFDRAMLQAGTEIKDLASVIKPALQLALNDITNYMLGFSLFTFLVGLIFIFVKKQRSNKRNPMKYSVNPRV
jgi:hypothetical protein